MPVTAGAAEQKGMQNYIVSTEAAKRQMNKEIAYAIGHVSELKNGSPGGTPGNYMGNLSSFIQDVTKSQPLGAKYMYASYSI